MLTLKEILAVEGLSQPPGQMELPCTVSFSVSLLANWIIPQRRMFDKVRLIGGSSLASKEQTFLNGSNGMSCQNMGV